MRRYVKYILWMVLIGLVVSCEAGSGITPSVSPAFIPESSLTYTPSPDLATTPTDLPLSPVIATPTVLPRTGLIVPTLEDEPDTPNGFAEELRLFFGEETILMDSMGIVAIHPRTGATLKLEEDSGAQFLNTTNASPLSPDRKWIAYVIDYRQLVLLDTSTADRRLFTFPGLIQSLAWMPDSQHLLLTVVGGQPFQDPRPFWLFDLNIDEGTYTLLLDDFRPLIEDISPDGKSFLYYNHSPTEDLTDPVDLMLQPVSGDPPIQLTDDVLYEFWSDITPDGQWLVVFADDPNIALGPNSLPCHWDLDNAYRLNLRTKEIKNYPVSGKNAVAYARLSPDGSKIAYVNAEGNYCAENFPIYILDLESGVNEHLDIGGFYLAWSPDGSRLVFMQNSPEFQGNYRRLVIYDLATYQTVATYYINDIDQESVTPYWVKLR